MKILIPKICTHLVYHCVDEVDVVRLVAFLNERFGNVHT